MKTLEGKTRTAFLFFFGSHIPATLCIDLQALFPNIYPTPLRNLLKFYTSTFNDKLMAAPHDTWFRAIVAGELLFQLPFFFLMVHALLNTEKYDGRGWFKNLCLCYGAHTATTLIPILACHCFDNPSATLLEKIMVISIYLPYLFFPLWMVFICFASQDIFGTSDKKKQ